MPYIEDEHLSLQRIPGQLRPDHAPKRTDPTIHTADHPFCYDPVCSSCRQKEIQRVLQWFEQGLLTVHEAIEFIAGRTF